MISVLDYGAGNANSVIRMIERVGGKAQRIFTAEEIVAATKLIIPGVGAFDYGMTQINKNGLSAALNFVAHEKGIPILGICLGMQLMCRRSDEGNLPGLAWIDADVLFFSEARKNNLRVPHMGWNTVKVVRENSLLSLNDEETRFYFVHSYRVSCDHQEDPISITHYGGDFVSAFQKKNIMGVQFHPEKSHKYGMRLIKNYLEADCA